jgi:hypothetical protein
MAVARLAPKCPFCEKVIAVAVNRNQSDIPSQLRIIGDDFVTWKYLDHTCKEGDDFNKEMKEFWKKSNAIKP